MMFEIVMNSYHGCMFLVHLKDDINKSALTVQGKYLPACPSNYSSPTYMLRQHCYKMGKFVYKRYHIKRKRALAHLARHGTLAVSDQFSPIRRLTPMKLRSHRIWRNDRHDPQNENFSFMWFRHLLNIPSKKLVNKNDELSNLHVYFRPWLHFKAEHLLCAGTKDIRYYK